MFWSFLLTAGSVLAWMLSPEALVILGNLTGLGGTQLLLPLAAAMITAALAAAVLHNRVLAEGRFVHAATGAVMTTAGPGTLATFTVLLASRISLVFFLPTGMLVSAGFAFNEILYHRFPNFAFSGLLLALILLLHLAGKRLVLATQALFAITTVACLLLLIVAGLPGTDLVQTDTPPVTLNNYQAPAAFFTTLILFLGYDQSRPGAPGGPGQILLALAVGGLIYALWSLVSLGHVPRQSLAESSLPHLLTAREVLGQPGRMIMALAVISGTCTVVNGLFLLANSTLRQMAARYPLFTRSRPGGLDRVFPVFFSLLITIALVAGLAGSDQLEVYIRGSLLLWLLATATLCYRAADRLRHLGKPLYFLGYPLCALYVLATFWLAITATQPFRLVVFCCLVLTAAALIFAVWLCVSEKRFGSTCFNNQGETI